MHANTARAETQRIKGSTSQEVKKSGFCSDCPEGRARWRRNLWHLSRNAQISFRFGSNFRKTKYFRVRDSVYCFVTSSVSSHSMFQCLSIFQKNFHVSSTFTTSSFFLYDFPFLHKNRYQLPFMSQKFMSTSNSLNWFVIFEKWRKEFSTEIFEVLGISFFETIRICSFNDVTYKIFSSLNFF